MSGKKEALLYLLCGIASMAVSWACMVAVNVLAFGNAAHPTAAQNAALGLVNWVSGMWAAFILTRRFVFRSKSPVLPEFGRHALSRAWTLGMDQAVRLVLGAVGVHVYVASAASSVIVTVMNYVLAKAFVFHKK